MSTVPAVHTTEPARLLADHGWRIFPVKPRTKRPLNQHGSKEATDDVTIVAAWWERWPWASIGALVPDHLVVVDLDPRNGCTLRPSHLTPTLTVRTGGGGWHLYYDSPRGTDLGAHCESYPGVDLIRGGRQVILPPSLHPSGEQYRWEVKAPVTPLPWHLADAFTRRTRPRWVTSERGGRLDWGGSPRVPSERYIDAARRGVVEHLRTDAVPGNRNNAVNAAAFRYWRLGLTVDDALADLLPVIPVAPDFTEAEARRTIESVWR